MHSPRCSVCTSMVVPVDQSRFTLSDRFLFEHEVPEYQRAVCVPQAVQAGWRGAVSAPSSQLQQRWGHLCSCQWRASPGAACSQGCSLPYKGQGRQARPGEQTYPHAFSDLCFCMQTPQLCKHHSYANTTAMQMYAPRHHIRTACKQRLRTVHGSDWRRAHTE